ncbi:MAG: hypothetical protein GX197_08455 [Firmicutes bacterium]|nr:hypothetical protein [Bacillota bacterium]
MRTLIPKLTKLIERLAAKNLFLYRLISLYYSNVVKNEVALAKIKATDRVLCIGGGHCPISGILLHEYTGAPVTIIDNDAFCVRVAKELIKNLGYTDAIKVVHGDGKAISPTDYNVIHVAMQVSPLEQVFCHLRQGCRLGAKILVRLPKRALAKFYSSSDCTVFCHCNGKVLHSRRNIESTALFIKSGAEYGI